MYDHPFPDHAYLDRDSETNAKLWFSDKGMGVRYVHEDRAEEDLQAAVKAERERCLDVVKSLCRMMSSQYTDPDPKYNTIEKSREFAAMMSEMARDTIADGYTQNNT